MILGNFCLGLASLGLILIALTLSQSGGGGVNDTGGSFILFFLSFPMFVVLSGAYCALVAGGKLDWLGAPRGPQYFGVVVSCLALTIIMGASAVAHGSASLGLPWMFRPIQTWAAVAAPGALIAIGFLWLNSAPENAPVLGRAFVGLSVAGIAAVGIALTSWFISSTAASEQQAHAKIEAIEKQNSDSDRQDLEKAKSADPEKDFRSLLSLANQYHKPDTRKLALDKILSNGAKFAPLLAENLQDEYSYTIGLRFLRDCDVPDRAAAAGLGRDAILLGAKLLRGPNHYASEVEDEGQLILDVADKLDGAGVDLTPAIREYRAALDTVDIRTGPRQVRVQFACRGSIDRWLARHKGMSG